MKAGIYTWYLTEGVLPQARCSPTAADGGCTPSSESRPSSRHAVAAGPAGCCTVAARGCRSGYMSPEHVGSGSPPWCCGEC